MNQPDINPNDTIECKACEWKGHVANCKSTKNTFLHGLLHLMCPECTYPLVEMRDGKFDLLKGNAVILQSYP